MSPEELQSVRDCRDMLQEEAGGEVGELIDRLLAHIDDQAAQVARLKDALIWARAEYLHTLYENPDCSAWNLDELSPEDQETMKAQAKGTLADEYPEDFP